MQDIRICEGCGASYLNNGEHECEIKPEEDDWDGYEYDLQQFAEHCQVESLYRGTGMWFLGLAMTNILLVANRFSFF